MLAIFLDLETTGLNPRRHRVVEIAFKVIDLKEFRQVAAYEAVVWQPQSVWKEADPNSLAVNQFTYELVAQGKKEEEVEREILALFDSLAIKRQTALFFCQNPSFDRAFFGQLIDVDIQEERRWPYHWLDLASMFWTKIVVPNQLELPSLSKDQIASYFGLAKEATPHRAMGGVNHLIACYSKVNNC